MSTEPLPKTLDVRKAASRGVGVSGAIKPLELQRFRDLMCGEGGSVQADLSFSRDEEGRYVVHCQANAEISVTCQRCLEPLQVEVHSDNSLAIVWTDEQASHLPRHLDPLIVGEEACNLWELVEDELILTLPPFNYHDTEDCNAQMFDSKGAEDAGVEEQGKPNPFNVLEQLKPSGDKH